MLAATLGWEEGRELSAEISFPYQGLSFPSRKMGGVLFYSPDSLSSNPSREMQSLVPEGLAKLEMLYIVYISRNTYVKYIPAFLSDSARATQLELNFRTLTFLSEPRTSQPVCV